MAITETIDNTDSAGEAVTTTAIELDSGDNTEIGVLAATIDNGFDVSVDVDAEVATDNNSDFTRFAVDSDLADALTIASGESDAVSGAKAWSYVRFEVTPASDPASGQVVVDQQVRRESR